MSNELSRIGQTGRSTSPGALLRSTARAKAQVDAETEYLYTVNRAHAFVATEAVSVSRGVIAEIRDAITEDPLGAELYGEILRGYGSAVSYRIGRAFQ